MEELVGFIAGALASFCFIPQIWRLIKLKSAKEISTPFTLMLAVGVSLWTLYGILFGLRPVIIWNAIVLSMALTMLILKFKYGNQ